MLDSLDTLIGFAVVMTVLSLLITIVTQMASALLSMRGKNLANALAVTLRTIDPQIAEHAEAVVEHILTRPGISDSILSPTRTIPASPDSQQEIAKANNVLSAIGAMSSAQAALDAAKSRLDDFEKKVNDAQVALQSAAPGDQPAAQAAYDRCMGDFRQAVVLLKAAQVAARAPLINSALARIEASASQSSPKEGRFWSVWKPGGFKLTNGVRSDEVYRIMHELAALSPGEAAARGLPALAPWRLGNLLDILNTPGETTKEAANKVAATLQLVQQNGTAPAVQSLLDGVGQFGAAVESASAQGFDRFQRWFDSTQDRAQQWFVTHTRVISIGAAFVIAFSLQLDVTDVYSRISTDKALRAGLSGQAQGVLSEAGEVLKQSTSPEESAFTDWKANYPSITVQEPKDKTRQAYVAAIQTAAPADQAQAAVEAYEKALDAKAAEALDAQTGTLKHLATDLGQSSFQLIPDKPRWPSITAQHFIGMLCMAALLSIGAPFWFNILKSLMNLRPVISQLIDDNPTQAPDSPAKD